jgi:hypothetical protein
MPNNELTLQIFLFQKTVNNMVHSPAVEVFGASDLSFFLISQS